MKKWGEIKQATADKMGFVIDELDVTTVRKFSTWANEALDIIANGVKPKLVPLKITIRDNILKGSKFELMAHIGVQSKEPLQYYDEDGRLQQTYADENTIYFEDDFTQYAYHKNKGLYRIVGNVPNNIIRMPENFLSFADMLMYHNNEVYNDIVYAGNDSFVVGETGDYLIYYNALWDHIPVFTQEEGANDYVVNADLSVIRCLPTYIASQALAQDDTQRSVMLKNDFELMLSRLDTNIMYQNNSFRSSGGWY